MSLKKKIAELEQRLAMDGTPPHPPNLHHDIEHGLQHHDWFHEMADRHEDVQNGRAQAHHLGQQLKHLPYEHAKQLVEKHAPPGKAHYTPEHHAKGTYWDIKY